MKTSRIIEYTSYILFMVSLLMLAYDVGQLLIIGCLSIAIFTLVISDVVKSQDL